MIRCLYIIADDFFHLLQDNKHFIEQNPDLSIEILQATQAPQQNPLSPPPDRPPLLTANLLDATSSGSRCSNRGPRRQHVVRANNEGQDVREAAHPAGGVTEGGQQVSHGERGRRDGGQTRSGEGL